MPSTLWTSTEEIELLDYEIGVPEVEYAVFRSTVNVAGQEMSFWAAGAGENALKRVLGCAMMVAMPENGIEEAVASLKDILIFNWETSYGMLPEPPASQRHTARIASTSHRPELLIAE